MSIANGISDECPKDVSELGVRYTFHYANLVQLATLVAWYTVYIIIMIYELVLRT